MEDETKDVNAEPSTADVKEDVNKVEETSPDQETQVQEETTPSTQEVKEEVVKDSRPIENVTWEVKRKLDEVIPSLQKEIQDLKSYIQTSQPQQPQYSKAQLMTYASDPAITTEQRLWAWTEIDKIEKEERKREYEALVKSTTEKTTNETLRAQSAQWVAQTFPETVLKDTTGNVTGWDNSNLLLQQAQRYMAQHENLRNNPEGFVAAIKMAAFDLGISPKLTNRTIGQLRKEQKKQLASSGGTRPTETTEATAKARLAKLQEQYRETGDSKIFAEIVKLKGLNPYI